MFKILIQTFSAFAIFFLILIPPYRLSNLLAANHFVLFSRAFIKDVNAWGLGTTHSILHVLRHQRPIIFGPKRADDATHDECLGYCELSGDQSQSRTKFQCIIIVNNCSCFSWLLRP